MINTIVGKPGGGKSYYSLRHIAQYLAFTSGSVVTNLSIDIPKLEAYCASKYPHVIDVSKRLRLLDEKQAPRFWLYRLDSQGLHVDLQGVTREQEKEGQRVNFDKITQANRDALEHGKLRVYPGILYVIDECHVFFDARAWAENGFSLTFYNSQHRKLEDDVLFVTQFLELVDKRVKGFSQEFIYLRNNGAEKFLTLFRGPSYFIAKHYQRPPSGLQDFPSEVHRFTLDLALAACYDTSAGVGIRGVGRPESNKKRGLSVAWIALPVLLAMFLLHQGPEWLASAAVGTERGKSIGQSLGLTQSVPPSSIPSKTILPTSQRIDQEATQGPVPYPTGYVLKGTKITVQMSDGTTRTESDRELTSITRNSATIYGTKHFFRPAPKPISPPSPASVPVAGPSFVSDTPSRADPPSSGFPPAAYSLRSTYTLDSR